MHTTHLTFLAGLRTGIPIFLGYFSIAVAFGLLAGTTGLSSLESVGMSVLVFAGASQFMALQLLHAGAGSVEIIITTLLVNLRHIIMSASVTERLTGRVIPRCITAFGVTDETFALATMKKDNLPDTFFLGVETISYAGWISGTAAGVFAGAILPGFISASLGLGLYALFVSLLVTGIRKNIRLLLIALTAGLCNTLMQHCSIPQGVATISAMIAGGAAGLLLCSEEDFG